MGDNDSRTLGIDDYISKFFLIIFGVYTSAIIVTAILSVAELKLQTSRHILVETSPTCTRIYCKSGYGTAFFMSFKP